MMVQQRTHKSKWRYRVQMPLSSACHPSQGQLGWWQETRPYQPLSFEGIILCKSYQTSQETVWWVAYLSRAQISDTGGYFRESIFNVKPINHPLRTADARKLKAHQKQNENAVCERAQRKLSSSGFWEVSFLFILMSNNQQCTSNLREVGWESNRTG